MIPAFPLSWPDGWPRARWRSPAPFKIPPPQARQELMNELKRLGATDIVVSTDQPLTRDGRPMLNRTATDPGVAVYFRRKDKPVVLACDKYDQLHDNMRAIGKTIEAMRGIERWGASDMLDRAFTGFTALPAPEQWWQVLGLSASASAGDIDAAFRRLAPASHPDSGGSHAAMARLNAARAAGRAARS